MQRLLKSQHLPLGKDIRDYLVHFPAPGDTSGRWQALALTLVLTGQLSAPGGHLLCVQPG